MFSEIREISALRRQKARRNVPKQALSIKSDFAGHGGNEP